METLLYPTEIKANKDHKCDFCTYKISKGEVYLKSTHKGDIGLYDWKTHINCQWIASKLDLYKECDMEEGLTQEGFIQSIKEEFYELMLSKVDKENRKKYSEVLGYLRDVNFRQQLIYVVHHYKKLEKLNNEPNPERSVATEDQSGNK